MTKINITNDQLMKIITNAFKDGEQWGVTYSTWFTPDKKQTDEKIAETVERVRIELMGDSK